MALFAFDGTWHQAKENDTDYELFLTQALFKLRPLFPFTD